jgi:heme exporter protein B
VKLYENLSQELNFNLLFSQNGHLTLAHSDRAMFVIANRAEVNRLHGIDSSLIYPDEIQKLAPSMQVDNPDAVYPIQGALYHPPGGVIRHDAVVWGLARGADKGGAEIHPYTEVTGISRSNGKVTGVRTNRGEINAPVVLNCTAGWSSLISDMAGVQMPITTHILQALVTLAHQATLIARKDLLIEVRGRHALGTLLPFAATVLVAFGFAFGPGRDVLERVAPGLLWMAVLFSAVMASRRAYQTESEDGALEGLLLAPIDKAAVFLGKAFAVTVELLALVIAVLLLVIVLFDLSVANPFLVLAAFVLGAIGLAAVGSLFGVVAESARTREAIFPMLVLPLVAPVLIAGVRATDLAAAGRSSEVLSWLGLLAAFDVVFLSVGVLVFGYLLED